MANSDKSSKVHRIFTINFSPYLLLLVFIASGLFGRQVASAQDQAVIIVTGTDVSEFPIVRLTVLAVDGEGNRLVTLPGLVVTEEGTVVSVSNIGETVAGVEYIFVIDADENYDDQDDPGGLTRKEIVRDSIVDFANNYMNQSQMDRVSVIVPGADGGTVLVDRTPFHTELINEINFFESESFEEILLNDMMTQALERAESSLSEGRAQAVILFTDGGQLNDQLDYETLVSKAQEIGIPIFSAILGARADESEIENVSLLGDPTGGSYVHLQDSLVTTPIYTLLEENSTQHLIEYRSQFATEGEHTVTVDAAGGSGTGVVILDIEAPLVEMAVDNSQPIRRVVDDAEAPISAAVPANQPIVARVTWPDGHPRIVSRATLLMDGEESTVAQEPELINDELVTLNWDISDLDEGDYGLVVRVTDELGVEGESAELLMTIEVARPAPAVVTEVEVQPTAVPVAPEEEKTTGIDEDSNLMIIIIGAAAVLALFILVIVAIVLIRRPKSTPAAVVAPATAQDSADATQVMMPAFAAQRAATGYLEPLENAPEHTGMIALSGENIAIGRDENLAQIVFKSKSVSRLHARIMMRGGVFQLYDEGSASGTYINYEQVSLTPQNIRDKDDIHFGQVHVRFHSSGAGPDDDSTQIMQAPQRPTAAPAPVDDDMSTQPYMPNQPPAPGQPQQPAEPSDDEDDISTKPYMPHSPKR
jgi:pSer/pThr/pTyr-binding forkhead associated (FHA) protein